MLKEKIDSYFFEKEQKNKKQSKIYITDTGKCNRSIFFNFKQIPKTPLDPRIARVFAKGNKFHNDLFELFYSVPSIKVIATEIHIPEQDFITGRADAIVSVDNEFYVVDIKSMNSFIFKKMENAKPENIQQIQLYLHFFGIEKGILFYIDKDKQEIKEFIITYDPLMVHFILQNFKKLKNMIDRDEVPPKITKDWRCSYCRFKSFCKLQGDLKTLCQ